MLPETEPQRLTRLGYLPHKDLGADPTAPIKRNGQSRSANVFPGQYGQPDEADAGGSMHQWMGGFGADGSQPGIGAGTTHQTLNHSGDGNLQSDPTRKK
jgi:hypothetical protein